MRLWTLPIIVCLSLLPGCGGGGGGGSSSPVVAPTGLTYSVNPAVYTTGVAVAPNAPSSSGGAVTSYGVSPNLPSGLSLDPGTGIISGTPSAVTAAASYTVTATNSAGHTTVGISITVNAAVVPPGNWTMSNTTVGTSPVGVLFDGTNIWVANENSWNIYKISASTGAVLQIYPAGLGAQYLAYDDVNNYVWTTNPASNNVTAINATSGNLVTYSCGNDPDGIAFDGANMWVANYTPATVTKIRALDGRIQQSVSVGTGGVSNPRLLAYDYVANTMWVTVNGDNKVDKIDVNTGTVLGQYAVPGSPYAIAFDGTCMWVTQASANTVVKIRTSDGAILGTYGAGVGPNGIAFDGTYIWITDQVYTGAPPFPMDTICTVTQLLATDGSLVGTHQVGERPQWVTSGGGYIWVTNGSDNTVSRCTY